MMNSNSTSLLNRDYDLKKSIKNIKDHIASNQDKLEKLNDIATKYATKINNATSAKDNLRYQINQTIVTNDQMFGLTQWAQQEFNRLSQLVNSLSEKRNSKLLEAEKLKKDIGELSTKHKELKDELKENNAKIIQEAKEYINNRTKFFETNRKRTATNLNIVDGRNPEQRPKAK